MFHEQVPDAYIVEVANVMARADWHTYQVLTKRSSRMMQLLTTKLSNVAQLLHIWWGVSVEDKKYGLPRVAHLQVAATARVNFLSIEPLLEDLGQVPLAGIAWVIVGGESGPGARPMQPAWVMSLRDQCRRARVPFFFRQWGGTQKSRTERLLAGRTYDEFPALPSIQPPENALRLQHVREAEQTRLIVA